MNLSKPDRDEILRIINAQDGWDGGTQQRRLLVRRWLNAYPKKEADLLIGELRLDAPGPGANELIDLLIDEEAKRGVNALWTILSAIAMAATHYRDRAFLNRVLRAQNVSREEIERELRIRLLQLDRHGEIRSVTSAYHDWSRHACDESEPVVEEPQAQRATGIPCFVVVGEADQLPLDFVRRVVELELAAGAAYVLYSLPRYDFKRFRNEAFVDSIERDLRPHLSLDHDCFGISVLLMPDEWGDRSDLEACFAAFLRACQNCAAAARARILVFATIICPREADSAAITDTIAEAARSAECHPLQPTILQNVLYSEVLRWMLNTYRSLGLTQDECEDVLNDWFPGGTRPMKLVIKTLKERLPMVLDCLGYW